MSDVYTESVDGGQRPDATAPGHFFINLEVGMDVAGIAVGGISVVVIVIGLVQASKRLGVSGKGALVLALVLGVVVCLAIQASAVWPWLSPWLLAVVQGLLVGLTASGLYDVGKQWSSK